MRKICPVNPSISRRRSFIPTVLLISATPTRRFATDVLARFQKLDGKDVFFLTGTDEHGQKMIQTAQREGISALELATRNAALLRKLDEKLNVSFSRFIRTSEEQHHRSVQEVWRRMVENGDIYLSNYSGWYSVRDESLLRRGRDNSR